MATIDELRETRLKKLEEINKSGFLAYPGKTRRDHAVYQALKDFTGLSRLKKEIILAGRIRSLRRHGKATFLNIEDGSGQMQALFREDRIGEKSYKMFSDIFDVGDIIEIRGYLFSTKTKEKTIEASDFKILSKSLLPLPEKWHGIQDVEERYRKRYLDLIFNPEVKKRFEFRSKIVSEIRSFLDNQGFLEVETPILQLIYGGAKAKPFSTHLNALDMDMYLRIAPELYLKRLIIGGFEKVYEIGRCFRNEGIDRSHNPEFTTIEFYWAYADYKDSMKLIEKLFATVVKKVFGKLEIEYEGKKINFRPPWPRIEFAQLLKKYSKIDYDDENIDTLRRKAEEFGVEIDEKAGKIEIADEVYKKLCLPNLWQPTFLINHPVGAFPLAKAIDENPSRLANFQVMAGTWELANAFSELNDPIEQKKRFEEQEKSFKEGSEEAQRMDTDYIEALEYGMPPAAGFGMGIDRLAALLSNAHSLREIILFPTMRIRKEKENENQGS